MSESLPIFICTAVFLIIIGVSIYENLKTTTNISSYTIIDKEVENNYIPSGYDVDSVPMYVTTFSFYVETNSLPPKYSWMEVSQEEYESYQEKDILIIEEKISAISKKIISRKILK